VLTFPARRRPAAPDASLGALDHPSRPSGAGRRGGPLSALLGVLVAALLVSPPAAAREPSAGTSASEADPAANAALLYSGFRVSSDGASRIIVTLSKPVTVTPKVSGKTAEYLLAGTYVPARNNKNALITRHFSTMVTSAKIVTEGTPAATKKKKKKKGKAAKQPAGPASVRVVVEMREAVNPSWRIARNADGTAALVIDFPRPTTPPPPEPDPVAPGATPPQPSPEAEAPPQG